MALGVSIRRANPADAAAIAEVHVASWQAHYRGLLSDEAIARRSVAVRREQWQRCVLEPARVTLVAEDDGAVVGFASAICFDVPTDGYRAYLHTLYLAPGMTGRRLGARLLGATARELLARGSTTMALRTLRENRARSFYERLGARLDGAFGFDAGHFDDVAYGFDDVRALVALDEFREAEGDA